MNKFFKSFGFWIILIAALFTAYYFIGVSSSADNIDFSTLTTKINNGEVESIVYSENTATIKTKLQYLCLFLLSLKFFEKIIEITVVKITKSE